LVNAWRMRPYDDEARPAAKDAGLHLRDRPAEGMDDPNAGLNAVWQPIPYEGKKTSPAATSPQEAHTKAMVKANLRRAARAAKGGLKGMRDGWRAGR
ncbi:MAG TPA: hypothetical protein VLQ78_11300, partial [Ornithinibacter sp.]|nr:hypothetical protein [Ornithinibacter sp.]